MRRLLILLTGFVFWTQANVQAAFVSSFNVSYLNMGNGLPSNFVDDIFEDDMGFVWIATHGGGLVRYDGYSLLHMGIGLSMMHFGSNYCRNVTQDRFRRLWVSFDEYTNVLDLSTMTSVKPRCATPQLTQKLDEILKERSMRVSVDRAGRMWIATRRHIYALVFNEKGDVVAVGHHSYLGEAPDVPFREVKRMGMLTFCGAEMLRFVLPANRKGVFPLKAIPLPSSIEYPRNVFIADIIDYDQSLWFATNQGLYVSGRERHHYQHANNGAQVSHDFITSLAQAPDGSLLIGTLAGVDIYKDGKFEHWNSSSESNPLGSNFVNCILAKNGLVWIGTESGGITKLYDRQLNLKNFTHTINPGSLSPNAVNAIYVEDSGTLWVGTVEGGLNRMAQGEMAFRHYTTGNSSLSHNSVSCFAADKDGWLWIGTWGNGLNRVKMSNPAIVEPFRFEGQYATTLNFIGALAYDPYNKALWIGANDGIFYYDLHTGQLRDPFPECRSIHGCVGSLVDKDGTLWMGCLDGLVRINLKHHNNKMFAFKQLKYKLDEPQSGIIDKITTFYQASDGTIWLGSNGYGLYRRIIDQGGRETFKAYTVADGLANNSVKGITADTDGRLWVATDQGLSLFDPTTGCFANFGIEDGLPSAQFYFNGAVTAPNGHLLFGTSKGLTIVESVNKKSQRRGRLCFTQFRMNGQVITGGTKYLKADITMADKVKMAESDASFEIDFSALNYLGEHQGGYSYRMKGYDNRWVQLQPGEHSVHYTSLPPGNYDLEVKYTSAMDDAMQMISMEIEVSPYFWKSRWFVSLSIFLLLWFAAWIYRRRMNIMKRRERDRILEPIEKALAESETPLLLQKRIQTIMGNQQTYSNSQEKMVEADLEETRRNQKPFMEQVMIVMEENYSDTEFGVTELSNAMNMSKSVLAKKLKAEMGVTTNQFIRNYRLDIAKKLIVENKAKRNITEIAYRVGFNDPKYFTRCFSNLYGVSPSAYKDDK